MKYKYLDASGAVRDSTRIVAPPRTRGELPIDLTSHPISQEILEFIPESVARENKAIPIAFDGETLTIATVNPDNIALADKLRFILAKDVKLVGASDQQVRDAITRYYGAMSAASMDSMLQEFTETAISFEDTGHAETVDSDREFPVVRQPNRPARKSRAIDDGRRFPSRKPSGKDPTINLEGGSGMFFYTVEEGQQALARRLDGTMEVLVGPKRVWRGLSTFRDMTHYVAHPGEYLLVRFRDGRQQHLPGPAQLWFDPRVHLEVSCEDALQIAAKEAVVVYSKSDDAAEVSRRIVYGPAMFVPEPGEWLHTFSWHASKGGSRGVQKVPNSLVFNKLWLMPDQMYHDVTDVRTADDAVLTIKLMVFFELLDIEKMLDTSHDPIGDFVNATTSDVVDFTGRHDFESFKRNTDKLNELDTYKQLMGRAEQSGYRIDKVVYRGYGAAVSLQQMHDQAIEARTRLQLEKATERQSQELENYKLDCQLDRSSKRRSEQATEVEHDIELQTKRQQAQRAERESHLQLEREQRRLEEEMRLQVRREQDAEQREHLMSLKDFGVDLTAYLTQARADRVIELRGGAGEAHVHLDSAQTTEKSNGRN